MDTEPFVPGVGVISGVTRGVADGTEPGAVPVVEPGVVRGIVLVAVPGVVPGVVTGGVPGEAGAVGVVGVAGVVLGVVPGAVVLLSAGIAVDVPGVGRFMLGLPARLFGAVVPPGLVIGLVEVPVFGTVPLFIWEFLTV